MSRKKEMSDEEFKRLWAETGGGNYAGEGDSPYDQEFLDSWRGKDSENSTTNKKQKKKAKGGSKI